MVNQAQVQARSVRRGGGGRHRHGTPGLRPYGDRIFDPAKERRRRPVATATGRLRQRRRPRHLRREHAFGTSLAMAMALLTALTLLLLGGYQAASGAVAVAGMFG